MNNSKSIYRIEHEKSMNTQVNCLSLYCIMNIPPSLHNNSSTGEGPYDYLAEEKNQEEYNSHIG
jgi:hypothetical protein